MKYRLHPQPVLQNPETLIGTLTWHHELSLHKFYSEKNTKSKVFPLIIAVKRRQVSMF